MRMIQIILFFIVLIVLSSFVSATTTRTASTDTICTIEGNTKTCTKTLYSETMNYLEDNVYVPIDTTITTSDYLTYDYEMEKGIYHAYFQDNINTGEPVRFEKDGYYLIYDLSGGKIQWAEQVGNPTKTKSIGALLSSTAIIDGNNVRYDNAFAYTDVEYFVYNEMLKENFILSQLPPSGSGYLFLEYTGEIKHSSSLTIYANGEDQIDKTFQTQGKIEFKDTNGDTIFFLPEPTITDAENNIDIGFYDIKISAGKILFNLRANKTFLESAIYPAVIDPTIQLQDADTENLDDTYSLYTGGSHGDELAFLLGWLHEPINSFYIWIKFEISSVDSSVNVSNAVIELYHYNDQGDSHVGEIYYWWGVSNYTWTEDTCYDHNGININCPIDSLTFIDSKSPSGIDDADYFEGFNITTWFQSELAAGKTNISIMINRTSDVSEGWDVCSFWSKEYTSFPSRRGYLNVTFTYSIPKVTLTTPVNDSSFAFKDKPYNFIFTINDSTYDILNATLWWNISNTWQQNITNLSLLTFGDGVSTTLEANFSRGHYVWNVKVCNINEDCKFADANYTMTITNSLPVVVSATINNSNPTSVEDIQCDNGSVSDLDIEDTVILSYDWYSSSDNENFVSYGMNTKTLDSTNLTANIYWYCVISPVDSYGDTGINKTSSTIQVDSSNTAPIITYINLTTAETGLLSNTTNPTNNNSYVKVDINWTDTEGDAVKVLACTTDSATIIGCGVGTWWNSSINLTGRPNNVTISFNIPAANLTTNGENNVYVFLVDNNSNGWLRSASTLGTFEVNFPPLPVNFSKTASPVDGTSFSQTFVNLSWTPTTDPDSDIVKYRVYGDTNTNPTTLLANTTNTRYGWAGLSDATYYWKVESLDEHNYTTLENSSIRSFLISTSGNGNGPGAGGGLAPPKIIEIEKIVQVERCGNFVCEECDIDDLDCISETPLNCPVDCKFFSFDDMFCTPVFNCGNWKHAWFINTMIIFVIGGMVYMSYRGGKLKKKRL